MDLKYSVTKRKTQTSGLKGAQKFNFERNYVKQTDKPKKPKNQPTNQPKRTDTRANRINISYEAQVIFDDKQRQIRTHRRYDACAGTDDEAYARGKVPDDVEAVLLIVLPFRLGIGEHLVGLRHNFELVERVRIVLHKKSVFMCAA